MSKTEGQPVTIVADNLSLGWAKVMLELTRPGVTRITPLTLVIRGFNTAGVAAEIPEVRTAVDTFLEAQGKRDTENVAWTIFPQRYWDISGGDRNAFFELFIESFERVQDFNPRNNKRGSYFQRLVDLNGGGKGPNQLNPCLQQVSFTFDDGALHLNAFYATQQIARKAYGNYLGLARLGAFMADQMQLQFEQMNVFVGMAQMDVAKSHPDALALMQVVKQHADGTRTVPVDA